MTVRKYIVLLSSTGTVPETVERLQVVVGRCCCSALRASTATEVARLDATAALVTIDFPYTGIIILLVYNITSSSCSSIGHTAIAVGERGDDTASAACTSILYRVCYDPPQ